MVIFVQCRLCHIFPPHQPLKYSGLNFQDFFFLMYDADPVNLCSRWKSNLIVKCRQQYFLKRKRQWRSSGCVLRQFVPNFFDFLYLDFFDGHSTAPASGKSHRSLNPHGHKMMLFGEEIVKIDEIAF